jgi:hypothetical protein
MQHTPNLKQLDLRRYCTESISEIYASLDIATSVKFASYLSQLDFLNIGSISSNTTQDIAAFWRLLREIYDPVLECSLFIEFWPAKRYSEVLSFDRQKKKFDVNFQWILYGNLQPDWAYHIDFLNLKYIYIEYRDKVHTVPLMRELIHPVLLERKLLMSVMNNDARVHLGQKWSDTNRVTRLELRYVKPENGLLQNIGVHHPFIEKVVLMHCKLPKEYDNCYLMDLSQFVDIHHLTFDLDVSLDEEESISELYIQFVGKENNDIYHYKKVQKTITYISSVQNAATFESACKVKILCVKIRQFVFNRNSSTLSVRN